MYDLFFVIGTNAASFLIGTLLGFFITKILKGQLKGTFIITAIVSVLWATSVAVDVYTQETNTSLFLHAFFGSVIGASNKAFFDNLTSLISKK